MGVTAPARVGISFVLDASVERWLLEEEDVPESPLHDAIIELLMLVLKHSVSGSERTALICSNLACRWDPEHPRVGTDPDIVLLEPAPPEGEDLSSLRVWESGHAPPRVAVEVVSANNPEKDYADAALRGARLGVRELWIFDPKLFGPPAMGGPFRLQVWRRRESVEHDEMEQVHAGEAPAYSSELGAWLVVTENGRRLRLAEDREGERLWPTAAEAEAKRAEAEAKRADAETKRADAEAKRAKAEGGKAEALAAERDALAEEKAQLLARLQAAGLPVND